MKGNRKYITILTVMVLAYGLIEYYRPKPINWTITLSNKDKIPFGTFATYELLKDIFPKQKIKSTRLPVFNQLTETSDTAGNYIFVAPAFSIDTNDVSKILDYVARGNSVFIAASSIDGKLADKLGVETAREINEKEFTTQLVWSQTEPKYTFKQPRDNSFFDSLDNKRTVVLGRKNKDKPDFIKVKHGKGNFYLNTNSTAFSNYFVLDKATSDYAFKCLSYLPVQPVIWDEYLKQGRVGEDDVFRVLFEHASLKWAYYIMILGILIFIIFEAKRRQRIIPVIEPLPNNTLEFTKVIGALYFNKADHTDAAKKKVNFLLEFIRTHFFERTNELDGDFIEHFTRKTGWDKEKMQQLIETVRWVRLLPDNYELAESDLIQLNNLIEEFYQFIAEAKHPSVGVNNNN
ncbi:DUF4350 domain-containing protein [Solitalea sp. MAHUQ-68]|uniref:DUF4350 domain-containing protein n=1 Tax=Solitalea agri TaxID=2953739 RepID=A0A9X2F2F7_9SPHI|nr:DUF4350 domain-containing protein [Solitalea agri]MCO4292894.1 DUF4350 domain-containing protein [Solitalea agri]